jgi:hypothetical protein
VCFLGGRHFVLSECFTVVCSIRRMFLLDQVVLVVVFVLCHDRTIMCVCLSLSLSLSLSICGRVVHEEALSVVALSAVTSAPELPHDKTRWFQKNDSRVDFFLSGV